MTEDAEKAPIGADELRALLEKANPELLKEMGLGRLKKRRANTAGDSLGDRAGERETDEQFEENKNSGDESKSSEDDMDAEDEIKHKHRSHRKKEHTHKDLDAAFRLLDKLTAQTQSHYQTMNQLSNLQSKNVLSISAKQRMDGKTFSVHVDKLRERLVTHKAVAQLTRFNAQTQLVILKDDNQKKSMVEELQKLLPTELYVSQWRGITASQLSKLPQMAFASLMQARENAGGTGTPSVRPQTTWPVSDGLLDPQWTLEHNDKIIMRAFFLPKSAELNVAIRTSFKMDAIRMSGDKISEIFGKRVEALTNFPFAVAITVTHREDLLLRIDRPKGKGKGKGKSKSSP